MMNGCESFPTTRASRKKRDRPVNHRIKSAHHAAVCAGSQGFQNLITSNLHACHPSDGLLPLARLRVRTPTKNEARVLISKYFRTGTFALHHSGTPPFQ